MDLVKGVNRLLIATYQGVGGWAMFAGIDADFTVFTDVPLLVSTYPADGAVDVPVDILSGNGRGISVTFDRMMDPASVKDSKLILTDLTVNSAPFVFDLGG